MKHLSKIILFLLSNVVGFMSVALCVLVMTKSGALTNAEIDPRSFQLHFVAATYLTWAACALFSVAYFFIKGKERFLFLLAPAIVPLVYGLYVLSRLLSS
jgi:hypothetical protein